MNEAYNSIFDAWETVFFIKKNMHFFTTKLFNSIKYLVRSDYTGSIWSRQKSLIQDPQGIHKTSLGPETLALLHLDTHLKIQYKISPPPLCSYCSGFPPNNHKRTLRMLSLINLYLLLYLNPALKQDIRGSTDIEIYFKES